MDHAGREPSRRRQRNRWVIWLVALLTVVAAYPVASWYTRRPAFCNVCHEMSPYYDAWQGGAHAEVACVDCHVNPGLLADVLHKPYELREVWLHFTTEPTFPLAVAIELPNDRCLRCHDGVIDPGIAGFDHEEHRNGRSCKTCHSTAGHAVTADALQAAGILNADAQAQIEARNAITVGAGVPLAGHVVVACSACHDMSTAACAACHEPPRGHSQRPCTTCHSPASWTFTHPDASATCSQCHDRPTGHSDGECSQCHAPGATWAFAHTTRTDCAACHTAPANHWGADCAQCHTPGAAWGSANFSHPRIEGGEHTYRSFDCAKCHPSGYASSNCTCHDGNPPEDDD